MLGDGKLVPASPVWFSETTSLISFDWFLSYDHLPNANAR
jgi:hypothetical protein